MNCRWLAVSLFAIFAADAPAQVSSPGLKLPSILSDHMVLQAGQADALWGWAPAGAAVKAEFVDGQGQTLAEADAVASAAGKWSLKLPALPSGSAGQLRFTAGPEMKTVADVVVGEAWLCGGQSNMTYNFSAKNIPPAQLAAAQAQAAKENGGIRFFRTYLKYADTPQDDSDGAWVVITPETMRVGTSCVAWYFAVALREKLHEPMGMVVCAVGGTRAEQWMSLPAVQALPDGPAVIQQETDYDARSRALPKFMAAQAAHDAWLAANPTLELQAKNKPKEPSFWRPPLPADLYNGMLHGLEPYSVRGVIWFQADGNLNNVPIYGELIKGLILNWRADFQADLPFYYVEMNNMRDYPQTKPVQYNKLSLLREQQDAALQLPGTDVVSSIDCGLPKPEPHFPNKEPVGRRLAAVALDHLYGFKGVCHGPTYAGMSVEGGKLRIKFTDADGLRVRGAGDLKGFAIRGATGDWVWAQGQVDGNDLLLWSDQVPEPAAARYAWAMNPVTSMENGAGFPMRPFRTDKESPQ